MRVNDGFLVQRERNGIIYFQTATQISDHKKDVGGRSVGRLESGKKVMGAAPVGTN